MTVYVVAQLKFTDKPSYDRYQSRFAGVFAKFEGSLLAADDRPVVLEGAWERQKVVLLSFPDKASYEAWGNSAAYQEISKDRRAGADAVVLLVNGMSS